MMIMMLTLAGAGDMGPGACTTPAHRAPVRCVHLLQHAGLFAAGVVGVAVTGLLLDRAGVENMSGWWQSFMTASALCIAGSLYFLSAARGDRIFGDSDQY